MVGPEQFLAPAVWIRNTVLTDISNHKNGWEKQQVLLSLWHKNAHKGGRRAPQPRWQGQSTCQPSPMSPESSSNRSSCLQAHHNLSPWHVPSSAAPQHPSIAPGTYFPIRSPPEGSQGFWQLLHHKAFSRLLHEHLCSRRAHKYPAAISASG